MVIAPRLSLVPNELHVKLRSMLEFNKLPDPNNHIVDTIHIIDFFPLQILNAFY